MSWRFFFHSDEIRCGTKRRKVVGEPWPVAGFQVQVHVQRPQDFFSSTSSFSSTFGGFLSVSPLPVPTSSTCSATSIDLCDDLVGLFPSPMASSPAASLFSAPVRPAPPVRAAAVSSGPRNVSSAGVSPSGYGITADGSVDCRRTTTSRSIIAKALVVETNTAEGTKECVLPTWAEFDLGRAPVFWKTTNGFPPTSGEMLKLFYNPAANNLALNDDFGVAFNGGFNQPIMCGGEPRTMTMKNRGKADPPMYSIQIRVPEHAVNLIFSFTNGTDWDGPYKLQFQVPKKWRNKPISFFNEGLAEELSKEGACEQAIFPDSQVVVNRCSITNLTAEGSDRCNLDFVPGCMDPDSHLYNPLANVDDGTCPIDV